MDLKFHRLLFGCSILFLSSCVSFAAPKDPCRVLTPAQIRSATGMDVAPGEHFYNWQTCKWQVAGSERSLVIVSFMFVHQFYNFKTSMNRVVPIKYLGVDAFYIYLQPSPAVSKKDTYFHWPPPRLFFLATRDMGIEVSVSGIPDDQRAADMERKLANLVAYTP